MGEIMHYYLVIGNNLVAAAVSSPTAAAASSCDDSKVKGVAKLAQRTTAVKADTSLVDSFTLAAGSSYVVRSSKQY